MTRKERTAELLAHPDTIGDACDHVANGGDIISWCSARNVRYSDVIPWLYDDERKKAWDDACEARKEWMVLRLLQEIEDLALVSVKDMIDAEGAPIPIHLMPDKVAKAVQVLDVAEGVKVKRTTLKLVDKLAALKMYGSHLRLFVDRVEHNLGDSLEALVLGSQATPPQKSVSESRPGGLETVGIKGVSTAIPDKISEN